MKSSLWIVVGFMLIVEGGIMRVEKQTQVKDSDSTKSSPMIFYLPAIIFLVLLFSAMFLCAKGGDKLKPISSNKVHVDIDKTMAIDADATHIKGNDGDSRIGGPPAKEEKSKCATKTTTTKKSKTEIPKEETEGNPGENPGDAKSKTKTKAGKTEAAEKTQGGVGTADLFNEAKPEKTGIITGMATFFSGGKKKKDKKAKTSKVVTELPEMTLATQMPQGAGFETTGATVAQNNTFMTQG